MKVQFILLILIVISVFGIIIFLQVINPPTSNNSQILAIELAFPNLSFQNPVDFQSTTANKSLIYVVEQQGIIKSFINSLDVSTSKTVLDIRSEVISGCEQGLLGLTFHPNFATNGLAYIDYTSKPDGRTVISQIKIENGIFNESSELRILEVPQPYTNHNAGQIMFGNFDNYLYITLGDGGSGGDPNGNGQNRGTLLGSILRIDVDHKRNGLNYSIPVDNPYYNNSLGFRQEIYAYGLRNPWRISQDSITGTLWAGDVGQNSREEVDIIKPGRNYGWNIMEGFSCYIPSSNCNTTDLTLPVIDYGHNEGYAITGGYVYRGSITQLYGKYLFADYGSGKIWYLNSNNQSTLLQDTNYKISSFGVDANSKLYFFDYSTGNVYSFSTNVNSSSTIVENVIQMSNINYSFLLVQIKPELGIAILELPQK